MRGIALLVFWVVATAGCVTELLQETQDTVRNHTCALLDPSTAVTVVVYDGDDLDGPVAAALHIVENNTQRPALTASHERLDPATDMAAWSASVERLGDGSLTLHVVVLQGDAESPLVQNLAPGVIILHRAAIDAAATATSRGADDVTRIALLHGLGHALGVVNQGTPFNGTSTVGREGPMHHEPSPRSIMHAGWHNAGTVPRTNATYDAFSVAIQEDWQGAIRSVCP